MQCVTFNDSHHNVTNIWISKSSKGFIHSHMRHSHMRHSQMCHCQMCHCYLQGPYHHITSTTTTNASLFISVTVFWRRHSLLEDVTDKCVTVKCVTVILKRPNIWSPQLKLYQDHRDHWDHIPRERMFYMGWRLNTGTNL